MTIPSIAALEECRCGRSKPPWLPLRRMFFTKSEVKEEVAIQAGEGLGEESNQEQPQNSLSVPTKDYLYCTRSILAPHHQQKFTLSL